MSSPQNQRLRGPQPGPPAYPLGHELWRPGPGRLADDSLTA